MENIQQIKNDAHTMIEACMQSKVLFEGFAARWFASEDDALLGAIDTLVDVHLVTLRLVARLCDVLEATK